MFNLVKEETTKHFFIIFKTLLLLLDYNNFESDWKKHRDRGTTCNYS